MSPREGTVVYSRNPSRPYDVEIHVLGCDCIHCDPVEPALPLLKLAIISVPVGTLIPFAWDARGMISVLASMIGVRI
jgi:hypothetical protein